MLKWRRRQAGDSGRGHDGNVGVDDSAHQPARPHHHRHLGCVSALNDPETHCLHLSLSECVLLLPVRMHEYKRVRFLYTA